MRNYLMLRRAASADWKVAESFGLVHVVVNRRVRADFGTVPNSFETFEVSRSVKLHLPKTKAIGFWLFFSLRTSC